MQRQYLNFLLSLILLIIVTPINFILIILIKLTFKGPIFYKSLRIKQNKHPFYLYKFRTMISNSNSSALTVGDSDQRITKIGKFLRKYKLDELPQFINVLKSDINIVGPRPDVPKYTEYYEKIFPDYYKMKPGITCYSSLELSNEAELYVGVDDPEKLYIENIIPLKIELDKKYYYEQSFKTDLKIILLTIKKIFIKRNKG